MPTPKKQILILRADGTQEPLTKPPTLKVLQEVVGGYIEHVTILDPASTPAAPLYSSMYVNEEGLIHGLPRNEQATELYQRNVRAQYPGHANPFQQARKDFEQMLQARTGASVIKTTPPIEGYEDDPYITGDVVWFSGYTRDEADKLMETNNPDTESEEVDPPLQD